MSDIVLGSAVFVGIVLVLVALVLMARAVLVPSRPVVVQVNGGQSLTARSGDRLLTVLGDAGFAIPSACGGAGTCGQCRVTLGTGCPPALPTEAALLTRAELAAGVRLACQTTLREALSVQLPETMLSAQSYACAVVSCRTVAPLIREVVLRLPGGADFRFTPGAFVMVEAPPYDQAFADYEVSPPHQAAWAKMGLQGLVVHSPTAQSRAYSIASVASDGDGMIVLLIRLALPPPQHPEVSPGLVSSYLFGRRIGDLVQISGPFGSFAAQDSNREMVFIGGGVGMAPLRAIIHDQLRRKRTSRKISFWYGARSRVDLFYDQEFDQLCAEFPNFSWTPALSDPAAEDDWHGATGFVHQVALQNHLATHPAPQDCEYYLCGPPMMIRAVLAMLEDLGVSPDHIFNDDFGG